MLIRRCVPRITTLPYVRVFVVTRTRVFQRRVRLNHGRGYALSGIGLSILFQFYRAEPLWIPIGWNGLFMVINISMIALLLKERNDAARIQEDPEQVRALRVWRVSRLAGGGDGGGNGWTGDVSAALGLCRNMRYMNRGSPAAPC